MRLICVIILCFSLCFCHTANNIDQDKRMKELNGKLSEINIQTYINLQNNFPVELESFYKGYKEDYPEDIDKIERKIFVDPLSPNNSWFGYVPLYDSLDQNIISYILLSCGLDGKMDNDLKAIGKLHLYDWKTKLKLYNPEEFTDKPEKAYIEYWKLNDEFKKGNKDLLIYLHYPETLKHN